MAKKKADSATPNYCPEECWLVRITLLPEGWWAYTLARPGKPWHYGTVLMGTRDGVLAQALSAITSEDIQARITGRVIVKGV